MKLTFRLLVCIILTIAVQAFSPGQKRSQRAAKTAFAQSPAKLRLEDLRKSVFADPFNEEKLKAYMEVLPRDEDLYVVEGDLLLTEQELRTYVVAKSQSQGSTLLSGELLVNIHNGTPDFYKELNQRNLTYAVDRNSFSSPSQYQAVVNNMRRAALEWQNLCPTCRLRLTYLSQHDGNPSHNNLNFIVRFKNVNGAYIAAAFFPHDGPVRRFVNVDPSYFSTSFNKIGVLRHELGHVLGYRHEQTRNVPGCFFEDNQWLPLTPYDPKSVMHYFCGGAGNMNLTLTALDRKGHRSLYRVP